MVRSETVDMCTAGGGSKNTTGSRCTTKKDTKTEAEVDEHRETTVNSGDQLSLGDVDKLPPVDAPEASNVSATRY